MPRFHAFAFPPGWEIGYRRSVSTGVSPDWRPVARVADVQPGDPLAVAVDGLELVVGIDAGRYFATQRRCPHRGGDFVEGIISRGHLICPVHGWAFTTTTGTMPGASPLCLTMYAVRVVGDQLEVDPTPLPRPVARSDS